MVPGRHTGLPLRIHSTGRHTGLPHASTHLPTYLPMKGLTGKTALITGASSGIGQAIAIRLAEEGCNVVINYRRDSDGAEATRRQALERADQAIEALLVKGDVSQEADAIALVQQTIAHFGRLDILINNAGVQTESPPRRSRSTALTGCWGSICGGPTCAPAKRSSTC